jgi:hypothetical protein
LQKQIKENIPVLAVITALLSGAATKVLLSARKRTFVSCFFIISNELIDEQKWFLILLTVA